MDNEIVADSAEKQPMEFSVKSLTQELRRLNSYYGGADWQYKYYDYNKDQILLYLKSPTANVDRLIEVSRKMFQNSPQYRRLIQYYAGMSMWAYVIEPETYVPSKVKKDTIARQYYKTAQYVEKMNIKHEMRKACTIALRDGVLFGVVRSNRDSWFIQSINPKYCKMSSIIDGCWVFSVNMAAIGEANLYLYPDEFKDMYAEYVRTGDKWQEVPDTICFCLKGDETVSYIIPPFAAVLPSIIDLENYRALAEVAKEIGNYKLVAMRVPLNDKSELSLPWDVIMDFYKHLANALPDYVGAAAVPLELDDIDFRDSNTGTTSDLEEASRDFWSATGVSPLLFGDASNNTASALRLSIRTDEEFVFALVAQCERLINHHLAKNISGSVRFRVNILPVTVFNQEQMVGYYKEAGNYGLPTKTAYGATTGLTPTAIPGLCELENEILHYPEIFVPLSSSFTMSSDGAGRPPVSDDELGDAGDKTRENETDANKE